MTKTNTKVNTNNRKDPQKPLIVANSDESRSTKSQQFGLRLHLQSYFLYTRLKGYGEFAKCAKLPELPLLENTISTKLACSGLLFDSL